MRSSAGSLSRNAARYHLIFLLLHADEFKVAVDTWMDGAVDGFASTQADWSYTIANSCGGNVPATSLTLSNAPEDLGSESGESDFVGYTVVQFEDTSPPSASDTVTAQQATCQLDISILFQDTVVRSVSTPHTFAFSCTSVTCRVPCSLSCLCCHSTLSCAGAADISVLPGFSGRDCPSVGWSAVPALPGLSTAVQA